MLLRDLKNKRNILESRLVKLELTLKVFNLSKCFRLSWKGKGSKKYKKRRIIYYFKIL